MPWMDGLKTMRSMRTAGVATPVILMTAVNTRDLSTEVRALGTNAALLRKPFDLGALEQAVARVTAAMPFDRSA
jgi:DNA-binding response OmpR family regulator